MTLDGKIATRRGDSKWISNDASRRLVHQCGGRMDAIVVGIGTALADDPRLTARPPGPRTATRIVLDNRGRLPLDSVLVRTAREVPTLVVTTAGEDTLSASALRERGCEVLPLPAEPGRLKIDALLTELGRRRMTNLLVEGGAGVHGNFLDAGAVDEVHVFIAPRLAGGATALTPVGGRGVAHRRCPGPGRVAGQPNQGRRLPARPGQLSHTADTTRVVPARSLSSPTRKKALSLCTGV